MEILAVISITKCLLQVGIHIYTCVAVILERGNYHKLRMRDSLVSFQNQEIDEMIY